MTTHNTREVEEKIRIALGELGATWEDPELVVKNVLDIFRHQIQKDIERLEGMKESYSEEKHYSGGYDEYEVEVYNQALQTIIDIKRKELEELNEK